MLGDAAQSELRDAGSSQLDRQWDAIETAADLYGKPRIRITQVEVSDVGRDAFDAKLHGRPPQGFRRINIRSRCRPRQRTKLPHPFPGAPQTFTAGRQNADSWRAALH